MAKLKDYRSGAPRTAIDRITGSTTINHETRVSLQINCSEYVILDYLSKIQEKGMTADTASVYINTGFTEKNQELLFKGLIVKGFIHLVGENDFTITDKWYEAFPQLTKEFDNFWYEKDEKGNNKVAWTGTKKKSIEYYSKLRKKLSSQYLFSQRNEYFRYLKLENKRGFDRQRMMCQVFLNPGNERYAEDWSDYCDQLEIKLGIKKEDKNDEPVSIDKVKEAYGKNTDQ